MFAKSFAPLESVSVPAFAAVIDHVAAVFAPESVLVFAPPSMDVTCQPTDSTKLSVPELPTRLWMFEKSSAPAPVVSLPVLVRVTDQVAAVFEPVSVFSPVAQLFSNIQSL